MKSVLLLIVFTISSTFAWAENGFYKSTEKLTLSYEEFRALSPKNQEAWIKELRVFNHNIEMIESGQRPSEKLPKYFSVFPWMMEHLKGSQTAGVIKLFQGEAAQADESCDVVKATGTTICLRCPRGTQEGSLTGARACAPMYDDPKAIADSMLRQLGSSENRGAKVNINADTLRGYVEEAQENGAAIFSAPVIRRDMVVEKVVTPSGTHEVERPLGTALTKPSNAEPTKTVQRIDASGTVVEQVTNKKGVEDYKLKELGDRGFRGNENLDVDEWKDKNRLACIYAGWAVQDSGKGLCPPVSEKTMKDAAGNKVTYSCKNPPPEGAIAGDNADGKSVVLCSPVVFGLKDGKPICIARSKNATEQCSKIAPSASEALSFAKNNPEEYRSLMNRVSTLCQGQKETPEQYEASLRKHFEARGYAQKRIDFSIKDVSATCVHLRSRMASLVDANKATAPKAGAQ